MRKTILSAAIVLAACSPGPRRGVELPPPDLATLRADRTRMMHDLGVLASDSLNGRAAGSGDDLRAARYIAARLEEVGAEPLWDEALVAYEIPEKRRRGIFAPLGSHISCNVVMRLRSPRPEAPALLLGAHYDHLGRSGPEVKRLYALVGDKVEPIDLAPYTLFPGANDNASGTAGIVEVVRQLAPYRHLFRRDLIVAAFGGEELQLTGSRALEQQLRDSLTPPGHMVNLEMLGGSAERPLRLQGACLAPAVDSLARSVPQPDSLRLDIDTETLTRNSDHASFADRGIPVSFFVVPDHSRLHSSSDTPEGIDRDGMGRATDYIVRYVYTLLTAGELPAPIPKEGAQPE